MTEILNSHQYYKLLENESSEYEFTTDNKVKYKVTFMEYGGDFYHFFQFISLKYPAKAAAAAPVATSS